LIESTEKFGLFHIHILLHNIKIPLVKVIYLYIEIIHLLYKYYFYFIYNFIIK